MGNAATDNQIGLADFIAQVRRELVESPGDGTDTLPLLMVDAVELELQVLTSKDGRGGIKVNVLAASGEIGAGLKRDDTHKVRVTLTPIQTHQERVDTLRISPEWETIKIRQRALDKGEPSDNLLNQ